MEVELLLERLREGLSIDELIDELAAHRPATAESPADLEALWRRCALVRSFDEELYDTVLARGLATPTFAELIASGDVEPLPTEKPSYHVSDSVRRRCFAAWRHDSPELQRVCRELVSYYRKTRSSPLDVFAQRIFAEPTEALADFEKLYSEADGRFDLAACDALLLIVRNRLDLIDEGSPVRDALNRREQYLRSRTLFADDFYRTVSYLHRKKLAASCERVLTDPQKWILHLYGKGGTGKTMFVRWLVARRCVAERKGQRIPVARLDFDGLDRAAFARSPWLILPAIGEQLRLQVEGSAFETFHLEVGEFAPLLRRGAGVSTAAALRKKLDREGKTLGGLAEKWFVSALGATPVVVVLDTIEEPLLHYKAALRSVLDLFVRIRGACPEFRVVLAGRYSIADPRRLPATAAALESHMESCSVHEFSKEESIRFLRRLRGVSRDDTVLAAIHAHTRGNPLELSLFAELLHSDPSISTANKVAAVYPITRFAYLLERIIMRIPDDQEAVRWLLRYAVVPRTLTYRFYKEVLAEHMPEAAQRDAPNTFEGELAERYGGKEVWKRSPRELRVDRIWKDLEAYAGSSSWVVAEEGVLRLQPEVVKPMRELLQTQSDETFRFLHRAATTYFERLAKREESHWAEHICEAIYHRFQLDGRKAVPFWRAQLADPRAKDPVVRERIAAVVLGSEFVDDETLAPPGRPRTQTIVHRTTCARAAFEACVAVLTQRLRMMRRHPEAQKLQDQIATYQEELERFHEGLKGPGVPAHRRQFLRGVVAIYSDRPREGERLVRAALARETRLDLRILMELCLATAQRVTQPAAVDRRYQAARQLAARTRSPYLPLWWIDYRSGWFNLERRDLARAAKRFTQAYRGASAARPLPQEIADCLRRTIQAYLETGQLTAAGHLLQQARGHSAARSQSNLRLEQRLSSAQLALARLDPLLTRRHLAEVRQTARERGAQGVVAELEGDVAAALLDTQAMERHYAAASEAYGSGQSLRGQINCHLKRARYYLEELGQGSVARSLLSQLKRSLDPQSATERFVLGARLAALSESKILFSPRGALAPAERARALAAVLSTGRFSPRQVEGFLEALSSIRSRALRGETLREFATAGAESVVRHPVAVRRLLRLLTPLPVGQEFPVHAYYLAAALRLFGAGEQARELLKRALARTRTNPYLTAKIQRALAAIDPGFVPNTEAALRFSAEFPALRATLVVEEAERCLARGDLTAAAHWLASAGASLDQLGYDTVWHVRAAELSGQLAELRGMPQRAAMDYRAALECAQRSKNRSAQTRLHTRLEGLSKRAKAVGPRLELRQPAVTLELQAATNALQVIVTSPGRKRSVRELAPDAASNPVAAALLQAPEVAYSPAMLDLLRDPDPRAEDAAREILATARRRSLDLALKTPDRSCCAFPWEMALDSRARRFVYRAPPEEIGLRETVTWIQAMLAALGEPVRIDGVLGPQTHKSLRSVVPASQLGFPRRLKARLRREARAVATTRTRVLVLRASLEQERAQRRGHGAIGLDITRFYAEWVGSPHVGHYEYDDPSGLERHVLAERPTLIHIVTGFLEARSTREVHLDFAQPWQAEKSVERVRFTASYLKSILQRLPSHELPPFVIVEAILPDTDYDRARQVLLRNVFCAELYLLARTRGVLAAGLFPRETLLAAYKHLFGFVLNPSAGDLHKHLWAHVPAAFPPALFAADPDLPVLG